MYGNTDVCRVLNYAEEGHILEMPREDESVLNSTSIVAVIVTPPSLAHTFSTIFLHNRSAKMAESVDVFDGLLSIIRGTRSR